MNSEATDTLFSGGNNSVLRAELQELHETVVSVDDRDCDSDDDFDTSGRLTGTLTENPVPHLSPEKSPLDLRQEKLEQFIEETCKCKLGPQKAACSTLFSQSDICT